MTTVFGRGLRGRRPKPEVEDEVTQIADEANLWWTRRDFVQNPVVRTRTAPTARPTPPAPPAPAAPVVDPTLRGQAFAQVFTTESLFGRETEAPPAPRPSPSAPPAPAPDTHAPPTDASITAPRPRTRVPLNHPLFPALVHLGLGADASWHDVQHAYRRLAKDAHPDHSGDDGEAMATLNAAYMALRDARRYGMFGDD
jgi:hypothetical protein